STRERRPQLHREASPRHPGRARPLSRGLLRMTRRSERRSWSYPCGCSEIAGEPKPQYGARSHFDRFFRILRLLWCRGSGRLHDWQPMVQRLLVAEDDPPDVVRRHQSGDEDLTISSLVRVQVGKASIEELDP